MLSGDFIEAVKKIDNRADLHEAWAYMKQRSTQLEIIAGFQFRVGDKVSWNNTRNGKEVVGVVTRINQKSISLDCGKEGKWKVSSSLLKKVN